MNRLIAVLALMPALLTSVAVAQTVSEDATMQLWCGTALITAFGNPPAELTTEQAAEAQGYFTGGVALVDMAEKAHLEAGFTREALDKLRADLVAEVTPVVTAAGGAGRYGFDDCVAIIPAAAPGAASSAQ